MYVARVLYPVKVLGPGNRIAIWFAGCEHKCKGCSNPELWEQKEEYQISVASLLQIITSISNNEIIDGFTLTGGDPLMQLEELNILLAELMKISEDIIVYTGFEYEEIAEKMPNILKKAAVLIDGKYIEERNKQEILRGSDNQRIIILKDSYAKKYNDYITGNINQIQNFVTNDGFISVGIHKAGYEKELDRLLKKKGMKKDE